MVPLSRLSIVGPQAFRCRSRSRAVRRGDLPGYSCPAVAWWQSCKPKEFPTTWLVFWRVLWMAGSIWGFCDCSELRPCNWRRRGNAASILVFPRWPIAPDNTCRNSVRLKSTSGSRNWLGWEHLKPYTDWEYPQLRMHSGLFDEWLSSPEFNSGGSVSRWRSFLFPGTPTRLPESIHIWPSLPISSNNMSLISLVIPSVEGSPWHISGSIFGRSSWICEATEHF